MSIDYRVDRRMTVFQELTERYMFDTSIYGEVHIPMESWQYDKLKSELAKLTKERATGLKVKLIPRLDVFTVMELCELPTDKARKRYVKRICRNGNVPIVRVPRFNLYALGVVYGLKPKHYAKYWMRGFDERIAKIKCNKGLHT